MKTCIYARKSTNKVSQSNTIENQIKVCKRYALKMKLEIVDVKIDIATGTNDNKRAEIRNLIHDGVDDKYQCVIIKGISRLYRNVEEGIKLLKKLHMNGIRVISIEENFDSEINVFRDGTLDISKLTMYLIMAEIESNKIGERVKLTQIEKAHMGMWNNPNSVPYGYIYNGNSKKLMVDIEKSKVIKLIFNLYASNNSIKDIISELENKNLKPPKSKRWREDTIRYFLRNQVYIGNIFYIRTSTDGQRIEVVKNVHESIIDSDLFYKVQMKLDSRAKVTKNQRSIFKGLVRCESCNSSMTLRKDSYSGIYFYYCSGYIKKGKSFCSSHKISAELLARKVRQDTKKYLKSISMFEDLQTNYVRIKNKLSSFKSRGLTLTESYFNGYISNESYHKEISELNSKIEIEDKSKKELEEKIILYRKLKKYIQVNKKLTNKNHELNIDLIKNLINYILVSETDISIHYKLEINDK